MQETNFEDWWRNHGSEEWAKAVDEVGTLKALEIVFIAGQIAQANKILLSQGETVK